MYSLQPYIPNGPRNLSCFFSPDKSPIKFHALHLLVMALQSILIQTLLLQLSFHLIFHDIIVFCLVAFCFEEFKPFVLQNGPLYGFALFYFHVIIFTLNAFSDNSTLVMLCAFFCTASGGKILSGFVTIGETA